MRSFRNLANDLYYIDLRRYSRHITSKDAAGVLSLDGHLRGSCEVFWAMTLRSYLIKTLNCFDTYLLKESRGCTGLVKVICKENKKQKGKRKYHAGTSHPNDRGGFTQWFGSCSLISTLYVWFPACWAPMVAERL